MQETAHAEAINFLFGVFELSYPAMYRRAWAEEASLAAAKRLWQRSLEGYPYDAIVAAAQQLARCDEFLPAPARFLRLLHALYFPWPEDAFLEACRAPSPKEAHSWSHALVYQAGYATGWEVLEHWPLQKAQARFTRIYEEACRRALLRGKPEAALLPVGARAIAAPPALSPQERRSQREWAQRLRRQLRPAPVSPGQPGLPAKGGASSPGGRAAGSRPKPRSPG